MGKTMKYQKFRGLVIGLSCVLFRFIIHAEETAIPRSGPDPGSISIPTSPTLQKINMDTILRITYEGNLGIAASEHDLRAAELAFRHFEREYNQFTPFLFQSNLDRDVRRSMADDNRKQVIQNQDYKVRVGAEKEFFDGSSVFVGMGERGNFGEDPDASNPFVEAEVRFPLLGSYTKLSRMISRTFEENEMFNARLGYVEDVRYTIQDAQENYTWLNVMREYRNMADLAIKDYRSLIQLPRVQSSKEDRREIEDEIKAVESKRTGYEGSINSYRSSLQDNLGEEHLSLGRVDPMDLYTEEYYGKEYMTRDVGALIEEARANDAEVRVLQNARTNAELEKTLAEKGRWDMFGSLEGSNDFQGEGASENNSGYSVGLGISLRFIDPELLSLAKKRAEEKIAKYNANILGRERELTNLIEREHANALNLRKQADELKAGVESRRAVFVQKRSDYENGKENIQSVIMARKNLFDSQVNRADVLGDFFDIIVELDQCSGVYFRKLGLSINMEDK